MKPGDRVIVTQSTEGYAGKEGTVLAVFPSGRCQVCVGPVAVLNLAANETVVVHEIPDRQSQD